MVIADVIISVYILSKREEDKYTVTLSFSWLFLRFPSGDVVRVIANLVQYAKRISFDVFQKPLRLPRGSLVEHVFKTVRPLRDFTLLIKSLIPH